MITSTLRRHQPLSSECHPPHPPHPPRPQVDAMDAWLMARLVPLVTTVDHYNLKSITKRGKLLVHIFVREAEVENPRAASAIKSQLARVGATLEAEGLVQRGDLTLALTNGEKYSDWMNVFGLEGAEVKARLWCVRSHSLPHSHRALYALCACVATVACCGGE